jgi:hypothetical protein
MSNPRSLIQFSRDDILLQMTFVYESSGSFSTPLQYISIFSFEIDMDKKPTLPFKVHKCYIKSVLSKKSINYTLHMLTTIGLLLQ